MRTSFDRSIPLAEIGNQGRASTESDTSAHSYRLQDIVITDPVEASPFAAPRLQRTNAFNAHSARPPNPSAESDRLSTQGSRGGFVSPTRRTSRGIRISMDMPQDRAIETLDNALIEGRVVKRRRRLPIGFVIFFGIVSVSCLMVALTTLSIGLYNFTKLRASRAAKTVDALSSDITPLIRAIYDKVVNKTEP